MLRCSKADFEEVDFFRVETRAERYHKKLYLGIRIVKYLNITKYLGITSIIVSHFNYSLFTAADLTNKLLYQTLKDCSIPCCIILSY